MVLHAVRVVLHEPENEIMMWWTHPIALLLWRWDKTTPFIQEKGVSEEGDIEPPDRNLKSISPPQKIRRKSLPNPNIKNKVHILESKA